MSLFLLTKALQYGKIKKKSRENIMVYLGNDWDEVIGGEFESDYYKALRDFLKSE